MPAHTVSVLVLLVACIITGAMIRPAINYDRKHNLS